MKKKKPGRGPGTGTRAPTVVGISWKLVSPLSVDFFTKRDFLQQLGLKSSIKAPKSTRDVDPVADFLFPSVIFLKNRWKFSIRRRKGIDREDLVLRRRFLGWRINGADHRVCIESLDDFVNRNWLVKGSLGSLLLIWFACYRRDNNCN